MLASAAGPTASGAIRNAADFVRPESPTCGIQEAIDALPSQGGVVTVPSGVWVLRRGVVLRSHVTLRGAGSTTVLTRGRQAHAKLTRAAKKGETSIEVDTADGFRPGDEVAVFDDLMHGWYMAHAIVKETAPKRLTFVEPLESGHPEGVFSPGRNAVVVNFFPFLRGSKSAWGEAVSDIWIADLAIDSNLRENPGPWTDFTLAAIHLANVSDATVRQVIIRSSVGDGIGVQGGRDNRVENCLVEFCRGQGLHPGTSLRYAVFSRNVSRHNQGDGLYFCAEVIGITVSDNLLHDNAGSGIGGLGEGGDRFNVVANNICRQNGLWGIQAMAGRDNTVIGNTCFDNSQKQPGQYAGILIGDSTRTVVSGNRCGAEGDKPTQKFGIEEQGKSDANVVVGNLCEGNVQGGISLVGLQTQASANVGPLVRPQPASK
jgi:parallel beta-helix repeat protein